MLGSALCGTATSIVELTMYRAIQGIGAGALVPIAFTIMFDVVAPESRGKLGGLFGAVFGLSSVFGPLLGAYITQYATWEWVFYINLPLGLIAFVFIAFFYKESHQHQSQQIDWLGAVTLIGAVVCLIFGLELGGKTFAWGSWQILGLFAGFVALALLFLLQKQKPKNQSFPSACSATGSTGPVTLLVCSVVRRSLQHPCTFRSSYRGTWW